MSKETKKSVGETKPAKTSQSVAAKPVATKSASVTAVKRPKAVRKEPAPKSPAKPAPKPSAKAGKKGTTILAQANIGFGNQMFIRGEGPGLSWDRGVPMEYRESDQWHWATNGVKQSFPFKVLINDQVWSHGENDEAGAGETKIVHPTF